VPKALAAKRRLHNHIGREKTKSYRSHVDAMLTVRSVQLTSPHFQFEFEFELINCSKYTYFEFEFELTQTTVTQRQKLLKQHNN
jgi:hypothetical protein